MRQVDEQGNLYEVGGNGVKELLYPIRKNEFYKIYCTQFMGGYQYDIIAKNRDGKFELLPRELSPHKNMLHKFEFIGEDLAFAYTKETGGYGENNESHWCVISRSKEGKFEDVMAKLDGRADVHAYFYIEKLYCYGALYLDIRALPTAVIHRTYKKIEDDYVLIEENGKKIERQAKPEKSQIETRSSDLIQPKWQPVAKSNPSQILNKLRQRDYD